ncbi:hypothetical protein [Streptomyces hygroscopicus]|uniref:hypothetical protein n=1 Tax=Streptomyces hygroscopicus TaxID=1912 RepID=UPI0007675330|nr:hypothetical protein [Streptomyces hygroscopicus]
MPAPESGHVAENGEAVRHRRLADLLADMVPGAATFRVALRAPSRAWPHPHARAYDAEGEQLTLNRTQAVTAARWIIRTHPEVIWGDTYDFDLAAARLQRAAMVAARGR